jgi:hypothetical protein
MKIVQDYMDRSRSDPLDIMPAMSAIAEAWARGGEDQYLAGLWRSHLPLGLLWRHISSRIVGPYTAPSWSWAAVTGTVYWYGQRSPIDTVFRIDASSVEPTHPQAPFGAVQSGYLVVHGLLQRTSLIRHGDGAKSAAGDLDIRSDHSLDYDISILRRKFGTADFFGLQVCIYDAATKEGPCGLILATNDGKIFERIGIFDLSPSGPLPNHEEIQKAVFQDIAPRRITII